MRPAISLITLGVNDIELSAAFYERLGWQRSSVSKEGVAFFQLGAVVLSLFGRDALLKDAGIVAATASKVPTMSLAQNVASSEDVLKVLNEAVAAGARLVKPGQQTFWGGFSGYFADLDGHLWEIAHNPFFALDDRGQVRLPD